MLGTCRAHKSEGELMFINRHVIPYAPRIMRDPKTQDILAFVVDVAGEGGTPVPIMFSAHTDTVHSPDAPTTQTPDYDEATGIVYKTDKMPLGADNAAGCWLLMEMIDAGVPGTYVFHRGEEKGGIGSRGLVENYPNWLAQFRWAIAFDRRGTQDVITHMFCGRTCSDAFAQELASKLNRVNALTYRPDDTGLFTDTANYRYHIPECTNVSVGYDDEHSGWETMDVWHLEKLRESVIAAFINGCDLPVERGVDDVDEPEFSSSFYLGGSEVWSVETADDVLGMNFKDLAEWVATTDENDVAALLYTLAEMVKVSEENQCH